MLRWSYLSLKGLTAAGWAVIIICQERDEMIQELNEGIKSAEEKLKELRGYL